jgi:hypothetical protein
MPIRGRGVMVSMALTVLPARRASSIFQWSNSSAVSWWPEVTHIVVHSILHHVQIRAREQSDRRTFTSAMLAGGRRSTARWAPSSRGHHPTRSRPRRGVGR